MTAPYHMWQECNLMKMLPIFVPRNESNLEISRNNVIRTHSDAMATFLYAEKFPFLILKMLDHAKYIYFFF